MRKRQIKKFAKKAARTKNISDYREAFAGGSKRLTRRARAFLRIATTEMRITMQRGREVRAAFNELKKEIRLFEAMLGAGNVRQ